MKDFAKTQPGRAARPARRAATAKASPPRAPLSRERIAEAALQLIDAVGLDQFSMRRLGVQLGVEAMALYHHFPAKGDVLDAVVDRLVDEIVMAPRGEASPLERLRQAMRSYRGLAKRHPRAFLLMAARRFNSAHAFEFYERLLEAFADCGLDAQQSARWFRLIGGFASGAGMADVASREHIPDATPLTLEHDLARIALPHVRAIAPHLRVEALDSVFDFGMEVLFEALERRMPAAPKSRSARNSR